MDTPKHHLTGLWLFLCALCFAASGFALGTLLKANTPSTGDAVVFVLPQ